MVVILKGGGAYGIKTVNSDPRKGRGRVFGIGCATTHACF
ncbi:putative holin-like toxin [Leuconostoc gelidum subsp. gasicomitatum]|nr:putative holin-like toxin [Leuconostoc gasicomitatum]